MGGVPGVSIMEKSSRNLQPVAMGKERLQRDQDSVTAFNMF